MDNLLPTDQTLVMRIASRAFILLLPAMLPAQTSQDFQDSVRAAMAASLAMQRASIQTQSHATLAAPASPAGFFTVAWPGPAPSLDVSSALSDCEPMPKQELDQVIQGAASKEGVDAKLLHLIIGKESAAKPCAISPRGAQGLMQLMPATAEELGVADPFDPKQNVEGGTRLLKRLLEKYNGDLALALGAYNAGSGRVDREGGIPDIPETIHYVSDIMSRFRP